MWLLHGGRKLMSGLPSRVYGMGDRDVFYVQEHAGIKLGDMVRYGRRGGEGKIVAIARLDYHNGRTNCVVCVKNRDISGSNGYATEYAQLMGYDGSYDDHTTGMMIGDVELLYNGPCRTCRSACKGEEQCAFFLEVRG